jgi:hypothetical protein
LFWQVCCVIQIRRRLALALRPCGRISKVVALRQGERIITLAASRQDVKVPVQLPTGIRHFTRASPLKANPLTINAIKSSFFICFPSWLLFCEGGQTSKEDFLDAQRLHASFQ